MIFELIKQKDSFFIKPLSYKFTCSEKTKCSTQEKLQVCMIKLLQEVQVTQVHVANVTKYYPPLS